MTLQELGSAEAVADSIRGGAQPNVVITFSAHWCGPCKASKPALQQLAEKLSSKAFFGIVYEDVLGEAIHNYRVKAFPTYILFQNGNEVKRVEGANLAAVEEMVETSCTMATFTGGEALGGSGAAALTPEQARAARLARLGGGSTAPSAAAAAATPSSEPTPMEEDTKPTPEAAKKESEKSPEPKDKDGDVEMKDSAAAAADASEETPKQAEDPTANLDPEAIKTLTESMGFSLIKAQKGLLYGNIATVEGAVEWLMEHQDDVDIDEPIVAKAQSYKCNDCGKVLSNMANLELHANKTGHSDFEESTERVKPLTEEEKAAKIKEIKQLLKAKRAEREEAEKVDDTEREKQRRFMGKEMVKTKEQLDIEQRKREAYLRKKEKEEFKKERARLRQELARDKAERAQHKGKLTSKLGVEGYKPDGIQYEVPGEGEGDDQEQQEQPQHKQKKQNADAAKIDEYIAKVSSYKAGGDGGNCLKILKAYVTNVVDKPDEEKFKTIKTDNKVYKTKVKPFVGAKNILLACGFSPPEGNPDVLVLNEDADRQVLAETKRKLEAAYKAYYG